MQRTLPWNWEIAPCWHPSQEIREMCKVGPISVARGARRRSLGQKFVYGGVYAIGTGGPPWWNGERFPPSPAAPEGRGARCTLQHFSAFRLPFM